MIRKAVLFVSLKRKITYAFIGEKKEWSDNKNGVNAKATPFQKVYEIVIQKPL